MSNIQQKHLELINQFNNIIDLIKGADTEEKIKMLKELPKLDADEMMNEFEEEIEEYREEVEEYYGLERIHLEDIADLFDVKFDEDFDAIEKISDMIEENKELDKLKQGIKEILQTETLSTAVENRFYKILNEDEEESSEEEEEEEESSEEEEEKDEMLNKQMDETSNKIKYIETSKIQKNKKNVVYICNNEDEEDYKDEERKPISIFWNYKDKLINHFMEGHYNNYSIYDFDFFLDFGFMDIVKKIFKWNYGQRIYFYTKTNADGYFNIWRETGDVGLNYCINENGYIETTIYNMTLSKNTSLVFDCNYNRKQKKLNDEKNYIDI
jgi:hypothetical protein